MYLTLKCLYVPSVMLFMGNIITGLFRHAHAARTRDARPPAHTTEGILRSGAAMGIPGRCRADGGHGTDGAEACTVAPREFAW
jgi:hypothetical protein